MKNESFRELLALRLFGELNEEEERRLDARLAEDSALCELRDEMDRGLGLLQRRAEEASRFESGFRLAVDQVQGRSQAPRPTLAASWTVALVGFAAGFLVALLASTWIASARDEPVESAAEDTRRFGRDTPPPPATPAGMLAYLTRTDAD